MRETITSPPASWSFSGVGGPGVQGHSRSHSSGRRIQKASPQANSVLSLGLFQSSSSSTSLSFCPGMSLAPDLPEFLCFPSLPPPARAACGEKEAVDQGCSGWEKVPRPSDLLHTLQVKVGGEGLQDRTCMCIQLQPTMHTARREYIIEASFAPRRRIPRCRISLLTRCSPCRRTPSACFDPSKNAPGSHLSLGAAFIVARAGLRAHPVDG